MPSKNSLPSLYNNIKEGSLLADNEQRDISVSELWNKPSKGKSSFTWGKWHQSYPWQSITNQIVTCGHRHRRVLTCRKNNDIKDLPVEKTQ
jgi:hypothetical protein